MPKKRATSPAPADAAAAPDVEAKISQHMHEAPASRAMNSALNDPLVEDTGADEDDGIRRMVQSFDRAEPEPPAPAPAAIVGNYGPRGDHGDVDVPDSPALAPNDAINPLTRQIGATYWRDNPVFDWCKMVDGRRHVFTRFYFQQNVLVDIFASVTNTVRKEVEQKRAAITQENIARADRNQPPLGYLPILRGSIVPLPDIDEAKSGRVLRLRDVARAGVQ